MLNHPVFDLDGGDPLRALTGGQTPPLTPNRGIGATRACGCGLSEYGGGGEDELHKTRDEHF